MLLAGSLTGGHDELNSSRLMMKKRKIILMKGNSPPEELLDANEALVQLLYDAIVSTIDSSLDYKSIFDYAAPNYFRFLISTLPNESDAFTQPVDRYLTMQRFCLEMLGIDVTFYTEIEYWEVLRKLFLLDRNESSFKNVLLLYKDSGRNRTTIIDAESKKYKEGNTKTASYYDFVFSSYNNGIPTEKVASITLNEEQTKVANFLDKDKIFVMKRERETKSIFNVSGNRFFAQIYDTPNIGFLNLGDLDQSLNLVTDFIIVRQQYFVFPETGEIGVSSGLFLNDNYNQRVANEQGEIIKEYFPKKAEAVGYMPVHLLSPDYIPRSQDFSPLLPIPAGAIRINIDYPNFAYDNGQLVKLTDFFEINGFKPKNIISINSSINTGVREISVFNSKLEKILDKVTFSPIQATPYGQYNVNGGISFNNEKISFLVEFDTFAEMYAFEKKYRESKEFYANNLNGNLESIRQSYYWREDW